MRKRPRTLDDLANWHSEMAREMYRVFTKARTEGWRVASYQSYINHGYAAQLLRDLVDAQQQKER